jgi:hypothetical protein
MKGLFRGFTRTHAFAFTALMVGGITQDQAWFAAAWVVLYIGTRKEL